MHPTPPNRCKRKKGIESLYPSELRQLASAEPVLSKAEGSDFSHAARLSSTGSGRSLFDLPENKVFQHPETPDPIEQPWLRDKSGGILKPGTTARDFLIVGKKSRRSIPFSSLPFSVLFLLTQLRYATKVPVFISKFPRRLFPDLSLICSAIRNSHPSDLGIRLAR